MSAITDVKTEDLATDTDVGSSEITVRMVGCAETQAMAELDRFLKALHQEAVKTKVALVVIDMRGLEFMNSSCFKTFVSWIGALQDSPSDSQYKVRFVAAEQKHWQSRSLGALACFAVDLITVESSSFSSVRRS